MIPKEAPFLSVIVPVLNGEAILPTSLGALADSDLRRERWELIVVDDGSRDDTATVADRWADRVVPVENGPQGPAHARNCGAAVAAGEVLVFVDADVVVKPDTLAAVADMFENDRGLAAAFGAYDDAPADPSFLSQYRNLFHRYVHLGGQGEADTFWAGCGAVRATAFAEVGGFDALAYPRPQIEDIELGYRLWDAGHRIEIRPVVQVKHLKRWTFAGMVRTDLFDRAIPWMRLLLARGARGKPGTLNVSAIEQVKTGLVGLALLSAGVAIVATDLRWGLAAALLLASVVLLNAPLYRWFARLRGWGFALRVIPLHVLYHALNGFAAIAGWVAHFIRRGPGDSGGDGRPAAAEEVSASGSDTMAS